ncbi:MAG: AI-2E family transporter [SAR324 cluster bacterium]|nr:AI-2E family transporter [SAR324 cluster bacterium]
MIRFFQKWGRFSIFVLLFASCAGIIIFLNEILFPFILACFLAYVLAPLIEYMHQWKIRKFQMPRGLAVILIYTIICSTLVGGGSYLIPNLSNEITLMLKELPQVMNEASQEWLPTINKKLNQWVTMIPKTEEPEEAFIQSPSPRLKNKNTPSDLPPVIAALENYTYEIRSLDSGKMEIIPHRKKANQEQKPTKSVDLRKHISSTVQHALQRFQADMIDFLNLGRRFLIKIASSIFTLFLTLMVSAFILVDVDRVIRFGRSLFLPEQHEGYERFLRKLDLGLNGVVRGQIIICLVNGIFTGVGLLIFGVPFVFTLSLLATLCSLIPIFGTFLSSVPIVIMALTVSMPTAFFIMGWILLIHFIEGNILNPKIIGTAAHIHPVLVVFALIAGEYVAGIPGALLAVPIFSIMQTTFFFLKSMIEEIEPSST